MNENLLPQTLVVNDWLAQSATLLAQAGILSAKLDSELIIANVLKKSRTYIHAHTDDKLSPTELSFANSLLKKRLDRMPLAYIIGKKEFYGREFIVNTDTLIPRPESELLIEFLKDICVSYPQSLKIIDVGTGSGILGITAKLEVPRADVTLSDISNAALKIASENAERLGASVNIINSDLLDGIHEKFDIILANLPYVDKSWYRSRETDHEPKQALFAEENGLLLIKRLIESAKSKINQGGYIIIESDPRQHAEISKFATEIGFDVVKDKEFSQLFKLS